MTPFNFEKYKEDTKKLASNFGISYREISEVGHLIPGMQEKLKKRANKAVDPIALETWINETLNEAEFFKIKGTLKRFNNPRGQTGNFSASMMFDYGIDRLTLNKSGISNENVDRLYR